MDAALRKLVRQRAGNRCQYCRLPQEALPFATFHVDHIVPRQHAGSDEASNLAWACARCNRKRGPNLSSIDATTGKVVPLFNPRNHDWNVHFVMRDAEIVG
jgi:HNH endonuclease